MMLLTSFNERLYVDDRLFGHHFPLIKKTPENAVDKRPSKACHVSMSASPKENILDYSLRSIILRLTFMYNRYYEIYFAIILRKLCLGKLGLFSKYEVSIIGYLIY